MGISMDLGQDRQGRLRIRSAPWMNIIYAVIALFLLFGLLVSGPLSTFLLVLLMASLIGAGYREGWVFDDSGATWRRVLIVPLVRRTFDCTEIEAIELRGAERSETQRSKGIVRIVLRTTTEDRKTILVERGTTDEYRQLAAEIASRLGVRFVSPLH